jgi:hypothetical protein
MRSLAAMPVTHPFLDIAVSNDYAYLACGSMGVFIVDVRHPERPVMLGKVALPDYLLPFACATSLVVDGQQLFVANGLAGLQIYNLDNPEQPRLVGSLSTAGNVMSLAVSGQQVYVADTRGGLQVVDCRNPDAPQTLGLLGFSIKTKGMAVVGEELIAATNLGGVIAVPLPFRISETTRHGTDCVELSVPEGLKAGAYALSLSDGRKNLVLPDALVVD